MSDIYWLEQRQEDPPEKNDWLGPAELSVLSRLVFLKRRAEWRLGRWTAKCAFALICHIPRTSDVLTQIEVRSATSGIPEIFILNQPAPVTISISHRSGAAICAIAAAKTRLGCDVEMIEPRTNAFLEDYFTPSEQFLLAQASPHDRPRLATLLWSAKESALKAMQLGLRADTRSMIVELPAHNVEIGWAPLHIQTVTGDHFDGWWYEEDGMIRTMASVSPCTQPILLQPSKTSPASFSAAD